MKTKTLEKWILLEQSGELSVRRQRMLDACPEAVRMREELNALCAAVKVSDAEPSPWASTKIDARLGRELRSILLPARVWKPVLALAACLTIVASAWRFNETSSAPVVAVEARADVWSDQFEDDLTELENLIALMSSDSIDIMKL